MGNTCTTATTSKKPTIIMQKSTSSMSLPEEGDGKPAHAANFRDMLRLVMANQARSPPHSVVAASEHSSSSESTAEANDDDRANVEEESNAETNDDDRANVGEESEHSSSPDVGLAGLLSQLQGPVSHMLYDRVVDHLNSEDLHFEGHRDDNVIKLCFAGNNANYNIFFDAKDEKDCIIVYVMSPIKIPEDKRMQACEYITRANYGIIAGNFEMDFRDGEVRFKSSIEFPEGKVSDEMIKLLWVKPLSTIDNYFPGLMRVVYSNESAADAIREIEPRAAEGSSGISSIRATAVRVIGDSSANINAATNE